MNRQVRRIEEKKERKQERDKAKAKADKEALRRERAQARRRAKEAASAKREGAAADGEGDAKGAPAERKKGRGGRDPGRFSGALMIASLFFIALQAMTPMEGDVIPQLVAAMYYLLFGYFAVMWLLRRGSDRPIATAVGIGVVLGIATGVNQWLQAGLEPAPLLLGLFAPLLVGGAFLGRVVYRNAPG